MVGFACWKQAQDFCVFLLFLYARLQTGRIMVWWCLSVRPSVRPSGSPSVSHSFPHFSPTCFDILSWNFACHFLQLYKKRLLLRCIHHFNSDLINIMDHMHISGNEPSSVILRQISWFQVWDTGNTEFSTVFSYTFWHIELKVCIWLCFAVLQIKFECHQFPSIFVGVMSLLDLRILEIHSFPHFSLTCLDILSWNFAYDFILLYYISSLSVVNFRQFV